MRHLGFNSWVFKYVGFIAAGLFAGVASAFLAYHTESDKKKIFEDNARRILRLKV
jgi:ABC-type uncharacterized transport system permease subunit